MRKTTTILATILAALVLTACGSSGAVKEEAVAPAPAFTPEVEIANGDPGTSATPVDHASTPALLPASTTTITPDERRVLERVRIIPQDVIGTMRANGCRVSGLQYTESFDRADITISCAPATAIKHASPVTTTEQ